MDPGSYNVNRSHRGRDAEVQRLAAQARLGWKKEARTLAWFGLEDGMSVLELGSGPGFITEQLLTLLPHSVITCLEIDPSLVAQAKEYLRDMGGERLHFVQASVMDTGLPDASFDFAYARLLYQHLPDPLGASREVWRTLKPGGRFYATTVGEGHMVELRQWVARFAEGEAHPWRKENLPTFTLENGAEQLAPWFEDVQVFIYEDGLIITETEPLAAYIRSMSTYRDLTDETCAEIAAFVEEEIAAQGSVQITKASGLFAARR